MADQDEFKFPDEVTQEDKVNAQAEDELQIEIERSEEHTTELQSH